MKWTKIMATVLLVLSIGCTKGGNGNPDPVNPEENQHLKKQVKLSLGLTTRVSEASFDQEDKIGLYMVYYNGTAPGTLSNSGNGADNVQFTYNGQWTSASPLHWKDNTTHADFYVYHPYGSPYNVQAYNFSLKEDQSSVANYKSSDFIWGKKSNASPADEYVTIQTSHIMSCMIIKLAAGEGFTEDEIANGNPQIRLNGIKHGASINLTNGKVTASGNASTTIPLKNGSEWKAIIGPQEIGEQDLITVIVGGVEYNLKKGFTFNQGKKYTFTVTLSKGSSGINVDISDWYDDGIDYGGVAE